jgi:cytoskeleton protein RodZ
MPDRPPTELGERLRRARETRGISLRQVSNVTRISVRALEAVERNDRSRLPGGIFTRAFVRAYATEVGLDPEATLRAFLAQSPDEFAAEIAIDDNAAGNADDERAPRWRRVMALALVGLTLAGAAAYGVIRWSAARVAPELEATPAPPQPAPALRTPEPQPVPALVHADNTAVRIPPGVLAIEAVARAPCWVMAESDQDARSERLMMTGDRLTVTAARSAMLKVGDAGALALTINGRAARPLGTSGQVVTVRIASDTFETLLAP